MRTKNIFIPFLQNYEDVGWFVSVWEVNDNIFQEDFVWEKN